MTTEAARKDTPFAVEAEAAMRQGPEWGGEEARIRALNRALAEARAGGIREALAVAQEEGASDIARCINDLIDGDETT